MALWDGPGRCPRAAAPPTLVLLYMRCVLYRCYICAAPSAGSWAVRGRPRYRAGRRGSAIRIYKTQIFEAANPGQIFRRGKRA